MSICLCIKIDKDIENVAESLNGLADYVAAYVICHSGRTPKTVRKVKDYFEELGIPGTVNYCNLNNQKAILRFGIYWEYMLMWNLEDRIVGTLEIDDLELDRYSLRDKNGKRHLCIYRSEAVNNQNPTIGIIEGDYYLDKKGSPQHKILEGYNFYPILDSPGCDIKYIPGKTLEELKETADNDPLCLGFNTLGWLKYRIKPEMKNLYGSNKLTDGIYTKDMQTLLADKIEKINNDRVESNLSFVITSCKRWLLFKETVDVFLLRCNDVENIQEWVCIDDNSSDEDREEMQRRYPFFRFIFKDEEDKGHQRSLNILLDEVKTDYIINFEDDWFCRRNFSIGPLLDYAKKNDLGQLIMRKISWGKEPVANIINGEQIHEYKYNPNHYMKPELNKEYDQKLEITIDPERIEGMGEKDHWWWPGFSLNPGLTNWRMYREKVGKFNEEIRTELFEYDYALRGYLQGIKVHLVNLNIDHTGDVSSYALNNTKRYYD